MKEAWIKAALKITGDFEGGGYGSLAGNFDGQGVSAGILQWNLGQGTLQLLLGKYIVKFGPISENIIFPESIDHLAFLDRTDAIAFAKANMLDGKNLRSDWACCWKQFLRLKGCIEVQNDLARITYGRRAYEAMDAWEMHSLRSFCFFFDVSVQNGSMRGIKPFDINAHEFWELMEAVPDELKKHWEFITPTSEQMVLFVAGYRRSRKSKKPYQNDVLSRKACIAMGRGLVHGKVYSLDILDNINQS